MLKSRVFKFFLPVFFLILALAGRAQAEEQLLSLTGQFKQGGTNYIWGGYMLLDPATYTIHGRIVDRFGGAYFKGSVKMNGNYITAIYFTKQYDKGATHPVQYAFTQRGGFDLQGSYRLPDGASGWATVKANYITSFDSVSKDY